LGEMMMDKIDSGKSEMFCDDNGDHKNAMKG
jgi:hypothetical protein